MSDDMDSKIQALKDMLSSKELPDNLKSMMSLMSNNSNQSNEPKDNNSSASSPLSNNMDQLAMISKVKKIMDKKSEANDPRSTLLNAIKPYLNPKRQSRIDNCSKILNFVLLSQLLNDEDL